MSELHRPTIAILASGDGSTAEAFIDATQNRNIDVDVGLAISNNPPDKAGIYSVVDRLNLQYGLDIQMAHISGKTHPGGKVGNGQTLAESGSIAELVYNGGFAHVALMGYMKKVRGDLLEEYGWLPCHKSIYLGRMSNTHPGPLPETGDTGGIHASELVLNLGLTVSKHTVHLVGAGIDKGPKLAEYPVYVEEGDTPQDLFERVQSVEKIELPYVIDRFLKGQANFNHDHS